MKNNNIIYQLTNDDLEHVANQEIDRNLTESEILILIDYIENRIDWYNIISDGIGELKI